MDKLNENASQIRHKYIHKSSTDNLRTFCKKRGLQAEINKLIGIAAVIHNNMIVEKELLRFRTELNKLYNILDSKIADTK